MGQPGNTDTPAAAPPGANGIENERLVADTSDGLTLTDGLGNTVTGVTAGIEFLGSEVSAGGVPGNAIVSVGPAPVPLNGQSGGTPLPLSTILGRTWHIDDFGAYGDGKRDDSSYFSAAIQALGQAGGGRLLIHPGKFYLCTSSQIVIKQNNVWLDCERSLGAAGGGTPEITGAIILAQGSRENPGPTPPYSNPERSTMALSMQGDNCKISNIVFISETLWNSNTGTWGAFPTDVCDAELYVFGQLGQDEMGMTSNGNGVQIDGAWGVVENCIFYGFNYGVVHVPMQVQNGTPPYGYVVNNNAPPSPYVRNILGDCWTLLRFGTTGNSDHTTSQIMAQPLLAPPGVPAMPYSSTNPNGFQVMLGDDSAGGSYLLITEVNGAVLTWTPVGSGWSNPLIGQPVAGNTITVSLYDNSGKPVVQTNYQGGTTNRFTGTWQLASKYRPSYTGFVIELQGLNAAPQYWQYWGVTSSGQPGATGVQASPGSIAFSALTRRGPAIFLNQVNARKFSDIFLLNNGFCMVGCEDITVTDFTGDGAGSDVSANTDFFWNAAYPAESYFFLDATTISFTACTGHVISWAGTLHNLAAGKPGGVANMVGVHIGSHPLSVYQNGNPMNIVGCFIGSEYLGVDSLSAGAGITATTFPSGPLDGNTLTINTAAGQSIWIDPSCTNLSASTQAAIAVSQLTLAAENLPAGPGHNPKRVYINASTGAISYG
jgi:hypothetical protein